MAFGALRQTKQRLTRFEEQIHGPHDATTLNVKKVPQACEPVTEHRPPQRVPMPSFIP
jgi:hypothetical protein